MKGEEINVKVTGEKQNPKENFRQDETRLVNLQEATGREGMTTREGILREEKHTTHSTRRQGICGTVN
jgi:hypothetical protein